MTPRLAGNSLTNTGTVNSDPDTVPEIVNTIILGYDFGGGHIDAGERVARLW